MSKKVLLIAGGGYVLGFLGIFISTVMQKWDVGPPLYVAGEAFAAALVWPYEIVKLFL